MPKRIPLNGKTTGTARELMLKSVLFGNLEPAQLDILLQHTRSTELEEGQMLFEQQRPANEIFMLQSGQVKLARISPEGQEKVIDVISPGNTFAEAIMFSRASVYPVTAAALCAFRVCRVGRQHPAQSGTPILGNTRPANRMSQPAVLL